MPAGAAVTPTTVAQAWGAPGYGIQFAPIIKEIMLDVKGLFIDNQAEVFTKYTGGREFSFIGQKTLDQALSDLGRELHSQYLISYNPNNKGEAGFHSIRVEVTRRGLEVRTRTGYWWAGVPGE